MSSHKALRRVSLRIEELEDRTVPATGLGANFDVLLDVAADVVKSANEIPTQEQAAQGSAATLIASAKALTANFARVSVDIGVVYVDYLAVTGNPAAVQAKLASRNPELLANVLKLTQDVQAIQEQGFNAVTFANFATHLYQLGASNMESLVVNSFTLGRDLAELGKAAGIFGQALGAYLSPDALAPIQNLTAGAQNDIDTSGESFDDLTAAAATEFQQDGQAAVDANQAAIDAVSDLACDPAVAPALSPVVGGLVNNINDIRGSSANLYGRTQSALADQIAALQAVGAEATSESIAQYNDEVLAIDQAIAALPADIRPSVAAQAQQYTFALADGAAVQLNTTVDIIGGQAVANIAFVSQVNTIVVPLYVAGNEQESRIATDECIAGIGAGTGGGTGSTGSAGIAGTYTGTYMVDGNPGFSGPMTLTITGTSPNPNGNTALPRLNGTVSLENFQGQTIAGTLNAFVSTADGNLFGGLGNEFQFAEPSQLAGGTAGGNFVFFVSPLLNGHGTFNVTRQ